MSQEKLEITKGDSKAYTLHFTNNDASVDITGWKVFFTLKNSPKDSDDDALISKTVTSHINASEGTTAISLTPSDTDLPLGTYYYDIQIVKSEGTVQTIVKGKLEITFEVTERVS